MVVSSLLATLAAAAAVPAHAAHLEVHGSEVTAGEIATGVPAAVVVARVPQRRATMQLSEAARRRLIENRFPGQSFTLRHRGMLQVTAGESALASRGLCLRTVRALSAGDSVARHDAETTACTRERAGTGLRATAGTGTIVASRRIAGGHYLGAVRLPSSDEVPAGTPMQFRTSDGPVTITRDVLTLQAGRRGRSVFARTADDQVIAARLDHDQKGSKP